MTKSRSLPARAARRRALALAEAAGGRTLAQAVVAEPRRSHAAHLAHELAIGHYLAMRLAAEASSFISRLDATPLSEHDRLPLEALRLVGGTARLMDRFRRGLLALPLVRGPGPDPLPRPAIAFRPQSNPAERDSTRADTPPPANRGWLCHGNRPGDYLVAPRCGACTRAGTACRQPAMKNGRCRFHGGKSTGPRTAAGLQRSRTARLVHGGHGEALRALRSAAAAAARNLARLTPARRGVLAGHGVHPTDHPSRPTPRGAGAARRHPPHRSIDVRGEFPTIYS
jgi:hypothetical protein